MLNIQAAFHLQMPPDLLEMVHSDTISFEKKSIRMSFKGFTLSFS